MEYDDSRPIIVRVKHSNTRGGRHYPDVTVGHYVMPANEVGDYVSKRILSTDFKGLEILPVDGISAEVKHR